MFRLQCPRCHNQMNYEPRDKSITISNKKKNCVYCGKTFIAKNHIIELF